MSAMDDNKDNKVSANELAQATNISVKEAELLIKQVDKNGDGLLDEQEFNDLKNKILQEQKEKERIKQIQQQRQERQKQQQQQYKENNQNSQPAAPSSSASQQFKHKW